SKLPKTPPAPPSNGGSLWRRVGDTPYTASWRGPARCRPSSRRPRLRVRRPQGRDLAGTGALVHRSRPGDQLRVAVLRADAATGALLPGDADVGRDARGDQGGAAGRAPGPDPRSRRRTERAPGAERAPHGRHARTRY